MNICLNCVVILCYLLIANFPTTFGFAEWLIKQKQIKNLKKLDIEIKGENCYGNIGNISELIIDFSKVFQSDLIQPESIFYLANSNDFEENNIVSERDLSSLSSNLRGLICNLSCMMFKNTKKMIVNKDSAKLIKVFNMSLLKFLKINRKIFREYSSNINLVEVLDIEINKKILTIACTIKSDPENLILFSIMIKGDLSKHLLNSENPKSDINGLNRKQIQLIQENFDKFNEEGLNPILFAYKTIKRSEFDKMKRELDGKQFRNSLENNLFFICMIAFACAPVPRKVNESSIECIKSFNNAGINVKIVSELTEEEISKQIKELGVFSEEEYKQKYFCISGCNFLEQIRGVEVVKDKDKNNIEKIIHQEKFDDLSGQFKVMTDITHESFKALTLGLKKQESITAVFCDCDFQSIGTEYVDVIYTNEGIYQQNSIFELKQVQCKASLDEIKACIIWDRYSFTKTFHSICIQSTANLTLILLTIIGYIFKGETIFYPIQIIWINFITMTFAIQTISNQFPSLLMLEGKPINKNSTYVSLGIRRILIHSISQVILLSVCIYDSHNLFESETKQVNNKWNQVNGVHHSMIFNIFIFMQIFNQLNYLPIEKNLKPIQKLKAKIKNVMILSIQMLIQIILVTYGGDIFYCSQLSMKQTLTCICLGFENKTIPYIIKLFK